jgi:hypothetical protein
MPRAVMLRSFLWKTGPIRVGRIWSQCTQTRTEQKLREAPHYGRTAAARDAGHRKRVGR